MRRILRVLRGLVEIGHAVERAAVSESNRSPPREPARPCRSSSPRRHKACSVAPMALMPCSCAASAICLSAELQLLRRHPVPRRLQVRQPADVVDAFHHDDVAHAALREHVAVEARERAGPGSLRSARGCRRCPRSDTETFFRFGSALQPRGQNVGPAAIGVVRRESAVGDRVAECDDGARAGGSLAHRCRRGSTRK